METQRQHMLSLKPPDCGFISLDVGHCNKLYGNCEMDYGMCGVQSIRKGKRKRKHEAKEKGKGKESSVCFPSLLEQGLQPCVTARDKRREDKPPQIAEQFQDKRFC